jgi:hypothetical protein
MASKASVVNLPLTAQLDETSFKIAECKPNVSKLIPEIKVPTNVVFDTRPPNHTDLGGSRRDEW